MSIVWGQFVETFINIFRRSCAICEFGIQSGFHAHPVCFILAPGVRPFAELSLPWSWCGYTEVSQDMWRPAFLLLSFSDVGVIQWSCTKFSCEYMHSVLFC